MRKCMVLNLFLSGTLVSAVTTGLRSYSSDEFLKDEMAVQRDLVGARQQGAYLNKDMSQDVRFPASLREPVSASQFQDNNLGDAPLTPDGESGVVLSQKVVVSSLAPIDLPPPSTNQAEAETSTALPAQSPVMAASPEQLLQQASQGGLKTPAGLTENQIAPAMKQDEEQTFRMNPPARHPSFTNSLGTQLMQQPTDSEHIEFSSDDEGDDGGAAGGDSDDDDDDEDDKKAAGSAAGGEDIRSLRPGASQGVADIVKFGLFCKAFYGASLKKNQFTVDTVLALKWKDARVAALVPPGVDQLSMSGKDALKKIWMPEVVITNRGINQYDLISSSVMIYKTGEVFKVERAGATINQMYELSEYPFDTQKLLVKVASSKYMLKEVVLEPDEDKSSSGADDDLLDSTEYKLDSWRVYAFAEADGALKKSRGVLELTADRGFTKYGESHLMPACLFLGISCGVFWFPFAHIGFITPRLALSIISLLIFTTLMIKSSGELPAGAPNNWNDSLNQQIQAIMFCTITLNIFSEIFKHQLKVDDLAQAINHEAKVLLPCLSVTLIILVMGSGSSGWMSLEVVGVITKVLIGVVMTAYIAGCMSRLSAAQEEEARKKEAKKQAELEEAMKKV